MKLSLVKDARAATMDGMREMIDWLEERPRLPFPSWRGARRGLGPSYPWKVVVGNEEFSDLLGEFDHYEHRVEGGWLIATREFAGGVSYNLEVGLRGERQDELDQRAADELMRGVAA